VGLKPSHDRQVTNAKQQKGNFMVYEKEQTERAFRLSIAQEMSVRASMAATEGEHAQAAMLATLSKIIEQSAHTLEA
jgi:hypothetical protein